MEGETVRVLGLKVELGPEVIQSFEEHKHDSQPGVWQTWGKPTWKTRIIGAFGRWFMRTAAKKAGYAGVFDER